jgi:TrmH family RNA methyltransferase
LPIARGLSAPVLLAQLRIAGVRVCAACPDESSGAASRASEHKAASAVGSANARKPLAPWEIDWRGPVALLIGNEGAGLPDDLVRSADAVVRIPHAPHYSNVGGENAPAESLNAAIAGSILLYEAARQRGLA